MIFYVCTLSYISADQTAFFRYNECLNKVYESSASTFALNDQMQEPISWNMQLPY